MLYECIFPEMRDRIFEMMGSSIEEIAAFDFGGPGDIWDTRKHWNCCPACRSEFPSLPGVLEQAGRQMDQVFAASLCAVKDRFLAQKDSLATARSAGNAYPAMIAELVQAEELVHEELVHVLGTATTLYKGEEIEFDPWVRPLLSHCREFISLLEPDVQHFVFASTLSFELLRPMWERVGLPARGRTREEVEAELATALATPPDAELNQEPSRNLVELLQTAIAESGLEPELLWEMIDAAASASVLGRGAAGSQRFLQTFIRRFEEEFDNFSDSIKATQMQAVRLSERSIRKAADYGPEVAERIGSLYSLLHDATRQQLNVAEFLYDLNRQEPNYSHGPVISLALAFENELQLRLGWPIVKELIESGVRTYPTKGSDGKKPLRPLIVEGHIEGKNLALGSVAWYLKNDADFRKRARARGFDPDQISKDAFDVINSRDKAAHRLVCELAEADRLRSLILRPDGILSRLHTNPTNTSKI